MRWKRFALLSRLLDGDAALGQLLDSFPDVNDGEDGDGDESGSNGGGDGNGFDDEEASAVAAPLALRYVAQGLREKQEWRGRSLF